MWRSALLALTCLAAGASAWAQDGVKLKTGEWIDGLEYGWMQPLFAPKEHTLTVSFLQDVDDAWRQQSRQELVTRHLIPSAFVHDYGVAVLSERRSRAALGPLRASMRQDWAFQHVEGWQWKQTDGPVIDWTIVEQEYVEYSDKLDVPSKFLMTSYPGGQYNLILNAVAKPDVGPEAAMLALLDLVDQQLQCSQSERNLPEVFSDPLLNGIYFLCLSGKAIRQTDSHATDSYGGGTHRWEMGLLPAAFDGPARGH